MKAKTLPGRLGCLAFLLSLLALPGRHAEGQGISLPLGSEAPPASLEDLDGNPVQLRDYFKEGKPTLLEFWASWCENCKALQPQLDRIQEEMGTRVTVLAVAVAVSQTQRRVKRHIQEHGASYPYLWDGGGEAVRAYNVQATSTVVILGADGRVAYTGTGRSQDLLGAVRDILGG